MTDIYAAYAHEYRKKGYSPLPLPRGQKKPTPVGWTGVVAPMASGPDVQAWCETDPEGNIALRLPDGVVGIDVDDYGDKPGWQTFMAAYQSIGVKPPSAGKLTARGGDGKAGIRLFRVPAGTELVGNFASAGFGPDVDIIQHKHRYCLGPGSIHPEGGTYTWYNLDGSVGELPAIADLPELPQEWIDALTPKARELKSDIPHEAYDAMSSAQKERVDAYVAAAVQGIMSELEEMKSWEKDYRHPVKLWGWEEGTLKLTASLASLVLADWTGLDLEAVRSELEDHMPHGGGLTLGAGMSKFARAIEGEGVSDRPFPPELDTKAEDELWDRLMAKATLVDFRQAGGGEAEPSAEEVIVEERPDDWEQQAWNEEGHVQRGKTWAAGSLRWLEDEEIWVTYDQIRWVRKKTAGAYAIQQGMKTARWTEQENYDPTPAIDEKTGQPKPKSSERDKFVKMLSDQSTALMFDRAARSLALSGEVTSVSTDFDRDPMVMGVLNGAVDLRTGELTPPSPESMISHVAPVNYNPEATAPRFMQYLEESLPDPEVRAYLKRVVGYSVSGLTIEQVMFLHHGKTSNGKSVLMDILGALLGEYGGGADPKALIETKNEQHSTHIASLAGPRFLMMSETARGARLSDTLIKNITGGDIVTARKLYKENQDLKIIGKIHMVTNHLPHIVASPSTNRRIQLINWPVEIAEDKIDLQLARKIIATELEGVLAWVIEGAIEWWTTLEKAQGQPVRRGGRPSGLAMPQQVIVDTSNYLRSEDDILEWMEERTQASETIESTGNLYQDYRSWAERRGVRNIMTLRAFSTDLEIRGELERGRTMTAKGFKVGLQPLQQNYWGN